MVRYINVMAFHVGYIQKLRATYLASLLSGCGGGLGPGGGGWGCSVRGRTSYIFIFDSFF